jgi:hypothetical protein
MEMIFVKILVVTGLLSGLLAGCSREGNPAGGTAVPNRKVHIQEHSGSLRVNILPESPTSSDDLRAVFNEGGNALTLRWEKNGQVLEGENAPRLAKSHFAKGDVITLNVTAGSQEGKASVTIANSPPEIRSVRFTPDQICRGVNVTAVPEGIDADGEEIRYECKWIINGEETTEDSLVLTSDRFKKGDTISVAITPFDGSGAGKTYRSQAITVPKAAPRFISTPPATFRGKFYSYNAKAVDPDGEPITYALASAPAGVTIDEKSGRITWPITEGATGLHTIEIVAQGSEGVKASQKYSLNITLQSGASE